MVRTPCPPEIPFTCGVICGCASGTPGFLLPVAAACLLAFLPGLRCAVFMLAGLALGFSALNVHLYLQKLADRSLPEHNVYTTMTLRCADPRITRVDNMLQPGSFLAEVESVNGRNVSRKAMLLVQFRGEEPLPFCGERFYSGGFLRPLEQDDAFYRYLAGRKIAGVWETQQIRPLGPPEGFRARICRSRDRILERVCSAVDDSRSRAVISAMFFGVTGGLTREMRNAYINSGTIHLFSISGMHVTAAVLILLLVLYPLPERIKYPLACFEILRYVISTGANPPAMRALLVLVLASAAKLCFVTKHNFQLLCIAACVLLLGNPFLVSDTGSQYSFVITAMLILFGERMKQGVSAAGTPLASAPGTPEIKRMRKTFRKCWSLPFAAAGCTAAFIAGTGISACSGNRIVIQAIAANLLLVPLVPLLFLCFGAELLFHGLISSSIWENMIAFLDDFCRELAAFSTPLDLAAPSAAAAALFTAAILFAAGAEKRRIRMICAAAASLFLLYWYCSVFFMAPSAAVISGSSGDAPVIVIREPRERYAAVINLSDAAMADRAVSLLLEQGFPEPDVLLFSSSLPANASGAGRMAVRTPPRRVHLPEKGCTGLTAGLLRQGVKNLDFTPGGEEFVKIFQENDGCRLEYFNPGSKLNFCIKWKDTSRGRVVSVNNAPGRCISWGNRPEVMIHEFGK